MVHQLEQEIASLPIEDKLWFISIDQQIRAVALGKSPSEIEVELTEMANEPDIQRKLATIKLEFEAANAYPSRMVNPYASLG